MRTRSPLASALFELIAETNLFTEPQWCRDPETQRMFLDWFEDRSIPQPSEMERVLKTLNACPDLPESAQIALETFWCTLRMPIKLITPHHKKLLNYARARNQPEALWRIAFIAPTSLDQQDFILRELDPSQIHAFYKILLSTLASDLCFIIPNALPPATEEEDGTVTLPA